MRPKQQIWLRWLVKKFVRDLKETWLRWNCFTSNYQRHLTPSLTVVPWNKSCLATIPDLNITTHSGSIGIEFWCWSWSLTFGVSVQPNPPKEGIRPRDGSPCESAGCGLYCCDDSHLR